jgi:uncharacterized protein (DUF433 family)
LADLHIEQLGTRPASAAACERDPGGKADVTSQDTYPESREDVRGGDPVSRGPRITCRVLPGRSAGGDTIADLCEDHSDIPRDAFEAAWACPRATVQARDAGKRRSWRKGEIKRFDG